jgi:hypothetical protein
MSDEEDASASDGQSSAGSGDGAGSGATQSGGGNEDAKPDKGGGEKSDGPAPEDEKLAGATGDPIGGRVGSDGDTNQAYQAGRDNFRVSGDNTVINGDHIYNVGDRRSPLLAGPVPDEELAAARAVYCEVAGYDEMAEALRADRLLVLCGDAGTGRATTALALLGAVNEGRVTRLGTTVDLAALGKEDVDEKTGYVAEAGTGLTADAFTDVHLDRLRALMESRGAYLVILAADELVIEAALRSRYGRRCPAPAGTALLERHLRVELADAPDQMVAQAARLADRPDVRTALGLDDLGPGETRDLARLLARRRRGGLSADELKAECARFAGQQAAVWFAGLDRVRLSESLPVLHAAAFRLALAVYNKTPYAVVAEAAELLVDEMISELVPDPRKRPGRPLFADDPEARVATARAELCDGTEDLGGVPVRVRSVRFRGDGLASAVLGHVWMNYQSVRTPIVRWLRALAGDPRSTVRVRAALAAGQLTLHDPTYGVAVLLQPMAVGDDLLARQAAAQAVNQAARNAEIAPAVRAVVSAWGRSGLPALRWTAAAANAYGDLPESGALALTQLARIGTTANASLFVIAGMATVHLLSWADPDEVLDRIGRWQDDDRDDRVELGLLAALRLALAKTSDVVAEGRQPRYLDGLPALGPARMWPLVLVLSEVDPGWGRKAGALIWRTVNEDAFDQAATDAVKGWIRGAMKDHRQRTATARLFQRMLVGPGPRQWLWELLDELLHDPDDPIPHGPAMDLWKLFDQEEAA